MISLRQNFYNVLTSGGQYLTLNLYIYSNNPLGNAAIYGDSKPEFLRSFAKWIKSWQDMQIGHSKRFTLCKQTASALIITLNATASL